MRERRADELENVEQREGRPAARRPADRFGAAADNERVARALILQHRKHRQHRGVRRRRRRRRQHAVACRGAVEANLDASLSASLLQLDADGRTTVVCSSPNYVPADLDAAPKVPDDAEPLKLVRTLQREPNEDTTLHPALDDLDWHDAPPLAALAKLANAALSTYAPQDAALGDAR